MSIPCKTNPPGVCKVFVFQPNTDTYASSWQCNGFIFSLNQSAVVGADNTPLVAIKRGSVTEELHGAPRLLSMALILGSGVTDGTNEPISLVVLDEECRVICISENAFPGSTAGQNTWRFGDGVFLNTTTAYRAAFVRTEVAGTLHQGDTLTAAQLQRVKLGTNGVADWKANVLTANQNNLNFIGYNASLTLDISGSPRYVPRVVITLSQY